MVAFRVIACAPELKAWAEAKDDTAATINMIMATRAIGFVAKFMICFPLSRVLLIKTLPCGYSDDLITPGATEALSGIIG
jgi:hypothetical protein